jgi:hypothetical protein
VILSSLLIIIFLDFFYLRLKKQISETLLPLPHHRVQTGSETHEASYPMCTGGGGGGTLPGGKAPGRKANHTLLSGAEVKNAWSYTATSPTRLHVVVLNYTLDTTSRLGALLRTGTVYLYLVLPQTTSPKLWGQYQLQSVR